MNPQQREQEVMDKINENSGIISTFWLDAPKTRWQALNRLEKRGVVKVKREAYPRYRVTVW